MCRKQLGTVFCLIVALAVLTGGMSSFAQRQPATPPIATYQQLRTEFTSPDHARWGEVPLWWWEGDRMTRQRVTWQLETLARAGVKSVCPIQRSPARCDPQSFSPAWWDMFTYVHRECKRLGMTLWAYDQVGYGHYGWLEKAAAKAGDDRTRRVHFLTADGSPQEPIRMELPDGQILDACAFPLNANGDVSGERFDISRSVSGHLLQWTPPEGSWRAAVSVAVDEVVFQLSDSAGDMFLDMFYGEIVRRLGQNAMGSSFVGVFQDEHPPTPRDVYTEELAATFRQRCGYDIGHAIPALHFDIGPLTPKYRTDFFDIYLSVDERCYWKRIYDWIEGQGLLTSHDNWGRQDIGRQSLGYIDYFRTQRWFSAPGYDDAGTGPVTGRNYYDTKIAASIARLYRRPRVWSEAFHSSGWGRTTEQTLTWLSANYAFGANLYDEHGLYYSTRASTWEHAAPDPHWRQPYWCYYGTLSDWVARTSCLMGQGTHVVDVAVHYPVVSLLAGETPGEEKLDYNFYMQVSRQLFDAAIDNDIIDDDSILKATIEDGRLIAGGNGYQAMIFAPERTMRRAVLRQAIALAESGGTVIFVGGLPSATTEGGRDDPQLPQMLEQLLGKQVAHIDLSEGTTRQTSAGGFVALLPGTLDPLPRLLAEYLDLDFVTTTKDVFVTHRRIGEVNVYLVQNTAEGATELEAICRVDGNPELWDPFTGDVRPVGWFERRGTTTAIKHRLVGNVAQLLVFRPGASRRGSTPAGLLQPDGLEKQLSDPWTFSVIPTRNNRWGEFRWPPSEEMIGPEIRSFRYAEEALQPGIELGWHRPDFDDHAWPMARYGIGPYWLCLTGLAKEKNLLRSLLDTADEVRAGAGAEWAGPSSVWQPVEYSKTIGLARPARWGGHSGYPDGAIDQNFIDLPEGRKLLFTRMRSPKPQRLGLRVELRNASARLWVNGIEQPFEDAVGNLPLRQGENNVLLDLPDGGHGMLYVQREPPSARSLAEAARGRVAPDLRDAFWIRGADPAEGYVRKTFFLDSDPEEARVVVTAYTGYRLFINSEMIHEEIGPWARWTHPESFNVAHHLRKGKNVIAAWIQAYAGQNVHGEADMKGLAFVLKTRQPNGRESVLVSDDTWRASAAEASGWQDIDFADSTWKPTKALGRMGAEPWGTAPLENLGAVTEPHRSLSIDLTSPYLTCFEAVPDVVYDVKPQSASRIGWYRFQAPPGLKKLALRTTAPARVWVGGVEVEVRDGVAHVEKPPSGPSAVAVRLDMQPGAYGGAAFPLPPGLALEGGTIQPGLWADFGLPTYSGIGRYQQNVDFTAEQVGRRTVLDLGQVLVAAEVLVNGRSAGVRLARPFQFDLTGFIQEGANVLEVRVANTIAPHYTVTNRVPNLGPTDSGLLGPVTLKQALPLSEWQAWARSEVDRLTQQLGTPTPELVSARRAWESKPRWQTLEPSNLGVDLRETPPGGSFLLEHSDGRGTQSLKFRTKLTGITGFRLELFSEEPDVTAPATGLGSSVLRDLSMVAQRADGKPFRGRYVRVEIPGRTEYLHMAEVQVFRDEENIARQGSASQSSTGLGADAGRVIDGDTDGSWTGNSVSHTHHQADPWWEVDLGSVQPVDRIVIFNRTDGDLEDRLSDFRVTLLDGSRRIVWQRQVAQPPNPKRALHLSPAPVEFVQPRLKWVTSNPVLNDLSRFRERARRGSPTP
ncbi:MAG: glycosyl hydrolase, partial [Pirellulaceae bacterium]